MHAFREGASAEEIVERFPAITLSAAYAAITFYLQNQTEIDAYFKRRDAEVEEIRTKIESRPEVKEFRDRLLARMAAKRSVLMLRYLADEDFDNRILKAFRRREPGLDWIRVQDIGLSGSQDEFVLQFAAENQASCSHARCFHDDRSSVYADRASRTDAGSDRRSSSDGDRTSDRRAHLSRQ